MGLGPGRVVGQGQSSSRGGQVLGNPGENPSWTKCPCWAAVAQRTAPTSAQFLQSLCWFMPGSRLGSKEGVGSAPAFCTVTERRTWPCGDTRQELCDQVTAELQSHALDGTLPKSSWLSMYDVSGSSLHALRVQALHPPNSPMRTILSLPSPPSFH